MTSYTLAQRLTAEALGTGLLVATVIGSGIMAERLAGGNGAIALLGNTIATAAILFVLITTLGPVSGAHFNPVVSGVFALRRDLPWGVAALYALVQVAGGMAGTFLAHAMFEASILQVSVRVRDGLAQGLSEGVTTFALILTILGTLRARPHAVPVSVALVITAAYWFTASTSFANPAVSIARSLTDTFSGVAPASLPGFFAGQLAGGVLAWLFAERIMGWKEHEPPNLSGVHSG